MTLYTAAILSTAAQAASLGRIPRPAGRADRRSTVCGSRVIVEVNVDQVGRVSRVGVDVAACTMGQVSAVVLARSIVGMTRHDLEQARDQLAAWLDGGAAPSWPGIDILTPALPHRARHSAIRIPFEAAVAAVTSAEEPK